MLAPEGSKGSAPQTAALRVRSQRLCLQMGQVRLSSSQQSMQPAWYRCKHGKVRSISPSSKASMQIVHVVRPPEAPSAGIWNGATSVFRSRRLKANEADDAEDVHGASEVADSALLPEDEEESLELALLYEWRGAGGDLLRRCKVLVTAPGGSSSAIPETRSSKRLSSSAKGGASSRSGWVLVAACTT